MIYVCGVFLDGILYVIDNKYYTSITAAKKRCESLNGKENKWMVLYQDQWKVYKGV
jgi:hypothetical protein